MLRITLLFCLVAGYQASLPGPCPKVSGELEDLNAVAGRWYLQKMSDNVIDNTIACTELYWNKPNSNGESLLIYNSYSKKADVYITTVSDATSSPDGTNIVYHFPVSGPRYQKRYIFGDDFSRYAILWTCENNGTMHDESAWIYSRQPYASAEHINSYLQWKLARLGLDLSLLKNVDTRNCW
ncbi:uncharacterized protein LOC103574589 [Microplitis demolitor]|uniref:uncharacterized protein LOC103574589 n=1 Tax=Microplitis demolitor TaxID=69319 RepID=UPI0004CCEDC3|nr:uncharacterized protein LOC103574589 [Microplitis demolitor]